MNSQHAPARAVSSHEPLRNASTRIPARWLLATRVALLVLIALNLVVYVVGTPVYLASLYPPYTHCIDFCPNAANITIKIVGIPISVFAVYLLVLNLLFALVYVAVAALIYWRKSGDWMGWLAAFSLVAFGASFTSIPWALGVIRPAWWLPVALIGENVLGFPSLVVFLLLFPYGRFVPRWTRWVALGYPALSVPSTLFPGLPFSFENWPRPLFLLTLLVVYSSVAFAQVYRYRRVSTPVERQQTKWIVLGASVALLGFLLLGYLLPAFLSISLQSAGPLLSVIVITGIYLVLLPIPLSLAVAILRYRLWDVDVLINKTLVYGLLTGILGALYAGLIIGLESLAEAITGQTLQQPVVLVISTLAIAALFQPLRTRLQRIIDRRFYRRKYDAARTLAAFTATLRSEVDLGQMSEDLVAVVQETMQPAHISLWLSHPQPSREQNTRLLPRIDQGERKTLEASAIKEHRS